MKTVCDFCKTEYILERAPSTPVKCAVCGHVWMPRKQISQKTMIKFIAAICAFIAACIFSFVAIVSFSGNGRNQALVTKIDEKNIHTILDEKGEPKEILCSYIPQSKSGNDTSGIKVKGVIQWVNADDAKDIEIRKYGYLLRDEEYSGQDFSERMNRDSVFKFNGKVEPYVMTAEEQPFQMIRTGYYKKLKVKGKEILSEIVSLKDNFNK